MAKLTLELDDALLEAAAQALGTHGAVDTVRAALQAASRGGSPSPRIPGSHPYPGTGLPPLGDPPPGSPRAPGSTQFPRPPEIH